MKTHEKPKIEPSSQRARAISLLRGTTTLNLWSALGLLAAGLIVTVLATFYIKADTEANAQREFDFTCNEIRLNIADRLVANAQTLYSGAAFFDASVSVEREEWRVFTRGLRLERQLPGIQGIGFAQLIPREQLAQHVQAIRLEGFPDYQVKPAGERETYSAIVFIEPASDQNMLAFGYDMLTESVRRKAMERARDENKAALSGKVILVQETGHQVQASALMYVPVYRHGLPIETIEHRRAAIQGWVYSPYRMTDLMRGTLRDWNVKSQDRQIRLQIYDGDELSADTLLYDSQDAGDKVLTATTPVTRLTPVNFAGHQWTLRFAQPGGLASMVDYSEVWLVLFGGIIVSLLLFGLSLSLLSTRSNALQMAGRLTAELRASEDKIKAVFDSVKTGIVVIDSSNQHILEINQTASEMIGIPKNEIVGKICHRFICPAEVDKCPVNNFGQTIDNSERTLLAGDGRTIPVLKTIVPITLNGRKCFLESFVDITERKKAEAFREMGGEILKILNEQGYLQNSIQRVLAVLKTRTGFDAVGIRLQEGDDFAHSGQIGHRFRDKSATYRSVATLAASCI